MTLFCLRTTVRLGAVLLSGVMGMSLAFGAEDSSDGGTFKTPTYGPSDATTGARTRPATTTTGPAREASEPSRAKANAPATPATAAEITRPRDLPPPSPGAFQRFVEVATGRQLPMFGASFFANAASSFAPLDNVPVPADYTVGPGDEVLVRAWGGIEVDYRATVDRNGQINLPKVGSFTVAGVKASDMERHLRAQIGRLYTNFNLNVTLGQLRGVKVFVVGPARLPGVYTLSSQSTLLSAVVAAGGPASQGSMRKVLLRREGKVVSELDIYDFLILGDKSKDLQIVAGDVVVFQPAGARVALNGALDTPAIYELKAPQEPLAEVLRYAGGTPLLANPHRVHLERVDTAQTSVARFVEEFKLDETGRGKPLRDGDVLTLLPISAKFSNEVTLKGAVAQALRHPFTPGMRIRDLIPDRDALISQDFYRRKNLLVQAGKGVSAAPTTSDTTSLNNRNQLREDQSIAEQAKKAPAALFDQLNWDYAIIERLNENDLSTQVISFNLGKAVLTGDAAHNLELKAGDVVTVYSQKDIRVPVAKQTRLVSLEGEIGAPGVYQLLPGETLKQLLLRAGDFTPQAYVYGLELTREETRERQRENLTAALARLEALTATQNARDVANQREGASTQVNASVTNAQLARLSRVQPNGRIALELSSDARSLDDLPDLPLENADRVVVPTRPGFVTVAGAVVNNNSFIWKPTRTAGDYITIAGLEETAEKSGIFILRADGTVDHAVNRGFLGFGGITSQKLNPGDAIVVPSQVDFESWGRALVRNLKDYSLIFSQFGLGALAIKSLRD